MNSTNPIEINFSGSGSYHAISPDQQGVIDLGICDTEAKLIEMVERCVKAGSDADVWDGWIAEKD